MSSFTNPFTNSQIIIPYTVPNLYKQWMYYLNCMRDGILPLQGSFFTERRTRNPTAAELARASAQIYQFEKVSHILREATALK